MIEHELKFALTDSMAAEFEQRATIGLTRPPSRLRSRYFDTSAGDLMNASVSLRVRKTPGGHVQTVKGAGSGPFERYEWEKPVAADTPDYNALPPEGHPAGALTRECFGLLMPVFETDFERQVRLVRPQPGVRVEIACDRGEIRAGNRSERIAEVELERKEGSAAAFYHYAMQWARLHQAQLLLPSKNLRGLQLAGWQTERPAPVKVESVSPHADTPVVMAARQVLVGHLNHFLANVGPVLSGTQPEGPHQLRVALRRFRSAIRFLDLKRPVAREDGSVGEEDVSPTWQDLDGRARALAEAASFVRDADVLESGLLASLDRNFPRDAALHVLGRSLATQRERERAGLRRTIGSADMTAFVLQAHAATESLPANRWPATTYGDFAADRLAYLVRRVRRRTRRARAEADWHEVRIAIKNLRYALDGCRALDVTTQPIGEVIAALSRWQDALGVGQDLAVARGIAAQALAHTAAPTEMTVRAAALIDGYRAFATRIEAPGKLRKPILAALERLLAKSPASTNEPAARAPAALSPSPQTATSSGYHSEGPPATSAKPREEGPDNASYKEKTQ